MFFQHYCCNNVGQKRIIVVVLFLLPLLLFGKTWKLDRSGLLCWWWRLVERPKVSSAHISPCHLVHSSAIMSGKSATLAESKSSRFHRRGRRPGAPCWSPNVRRSCLEPRTDRGGRPHLGRPWQCGYRGKCGSVVVWLPAATSTLAASGHKQERTSLAPSQATALASRAGATKLAETRRLPSFERLIQRTEHEAWTSLKRRSDVH